MAMMAAKIRAADDGARNATHDGADRTRDDGASSSPYRGAGQRSVLRAGGGRQRNHGNRGRGKHELAHELFSRIIMYRRETLVP
jgi:hypothetical protein